MADKYYRLVCFLVNITPQPLRKLFLQYTKTDPKFSTCSTIDACLKLMKEQIILLKKKKVVRQVQWELLFPSAPGKLVDETSWDITLVILLIEEFYGNKLQQVEEVAISKIREIRNRLQHFAETSIDDADFDNMWTILECATNDIAKQIQPSTMYVNTIKKYIKKTKINNMPNLGDSLRYFYETIISQMKSDMEDMKEIIEELADKCNESRNILLNTTEKRVGPTGEKVKRIKTVDHILRRLTDNFTTSMKEDLPNNFDSPPEVADIRTKLRDVHHVVVTGSRGSRYIEAALASLRSMDYNHNRCVEMKDFCDWRHIDPNEVDLVLCREPFGDFVFDKDKTKAMADIFSSMLQASKNIDIVIVSEKEILQQVLEFREHDLLHEVVEVYQHTTESDPADLTVKAQSSMTDQKTLNMIWKRTDKNKYKIYEECERISKFIENISSSIVHVWPAYDTNANDDIVFVVLTTKNIEDDLQVKETLKKTGYNVFVTHVDSCSKESEQVLQKVDQLETTQYFSKLEDLRSVINKHSDRLLRNHQYLSAISGSNVRSEKFSLGQSEHFVSFQPCIVLYVIAKGKIPLHENKFEDNLDGIPVDVREGIFQRTTLPSARYSIPVKMGCQITSNRTPGSFGTLGGFFYHKDFGLCGVTCAHVVLDEAMMHDLRGEKKVYSNEESPIVFHPNTTQQEYRLGPVKEAVYRTGSEDSSGIDIAIFKIESAAPDSGFFPEHPEMRFETGRTLGTSDLQYNTPVLKYGRTTALTRGYIGYENTTVRMIKYERNYTLGSYEYTFLLKNQIAVRPEATSCSQFNDFGDSGAFVFVKDSDNHLVCIGICVGKLNTHGIVIPISAVKEDLGISNFYDFRFNRLSEKINEMDKKLDMILDRLPSSSSK